MTGILDEKGNMPRSNMAFIADGFGTMLGGLLGSSALTTYVESASAVREGGRTGQYFSNAQAPSPTAATIGCDWLTSHLRVATSVAERLKFERTLSPGKTKPPPAAVLCCLMRAGITAIVCALFFFAACFLSPLFSVIPAIATGPILALIGVLIFMPSVFEVRLAAILTQRALPAHRRHRLGLKGHTVPQSLLRLAPCTMRQVVALPMPLTYEPRTTQCTCADQLARHHGRHPRLRDHAGYALHSQHRLRHHRRSFGARHH